MLPRQRVKLVTLRILKTQKEDNLLEILQTEPRILSSIYLIHPFSA